MKLDAGATLIGFVGDPVAQGKAPAPLTELLQARGANAVVVPMLVVPERFDAVFEAVANIRNFAGFVAGLRAKSINPRARRAAILGAGGAGTAIAFALADESPERLRIHDKDPARATVLVERLRRIDAPAVVWDGHSTSGDDLLVNATPVGMGPAGGLPISPGALRPDLLVAEAVMEPEMTPLLLEARGRGCAIHAGRHMMDGQLELMARYFSPNG